MKSRMGREKEARTVAYMKIVRDALKVLYLIRSTRTKYAIYKGSTSLKRMLKYSILLDATIYTSSKTVCQAVSNKPTKGSSKAPKHPRNGPPEGPPPWNARPQHHRFPITKGLIKHNVPPYVQSVWLPSLH